MADKDLTTRPTGHYVDARGRHWLHQVYDGSTYGAPERDVDHWIDPWGDVADPPDRLVRLVPADEDEPVELRADLERALEDLRGCAADLSARDAVIAEAREHLGAYILQTTQDGGTPDIEVVAADDDLSRVPQGAAEPSGPQPSEREKRDLSRLIPDNCGTVTFTDEAIVQKLGDEERRISELVLSWGPNGTITRQRRRITISATPWEQYDAEEGGK